MMAFSSVCLVLCLCTALSAATLTVTPNQSQFFQLNDIALACVTNSSGWTVMREIKNHPPQKCHRGWGIPKDSSCNMKSPIPIDTGKYWCESELGEQSNRVNVTVTDRTVILESPSYPVLEGENVGLGCSYKEGNGKSTSEFDAAFYKDDVFIRKEKPGKIIIEAKEGFYKCRHPSKGESLTSWLEVRARGPQAEVSPPPSRPSGPDVPWNRVISFILLFILYTIILILCIYTYRKWARAKTDMKRRIDDHVLVN